VGKYVIILSYMQRKAGIKPVFYQAPDRKTVCDDISGQGQMGACYVKLNASQRISTELIYHDHQNLSLYMCFQIKQNRT